jgi:hypothetical protein
MKPDTERPTIVDVHARMLDTAKEFLADDKELAREIILQVAEEIRTLMMAEERAKIFESYETRDTDISGIFTSSLRPDYETPANDNPLDFTK